MRFFLSTRTPDPTRILLVESGSRDVLERSLVHMRKVFPSARYELCTCFSGEPVSFPIDRTWRVTDAPGAFSKLGMAFRIARSRPPVAAMLFSGEPILLRWKLLLMMLLPSKLLIVNENGDFFWLDRANIKVLRQFIGVRWGVGGEELLRGIFRLLLFPIVFLGLLITAGMIYSIRWGRLLTQKPPFSPR